jgi:hypothetical protein
LIELFRNRLNSKSNWQQFVVQGRKEELQKLRNELGELGGAGHFWGNDKAKCHGGERWWMREEEDLKKVLRLLAAGEKKISLKEREFRAFKSEKNGEKLKKSFFIVTIGTSPRLDGRYSSRLLRIGKEEMENITISGWNKKVKIKI